MSDPVVSPPATLAAWVGRSEVAEDVITAAPAVGLAATLDLPASDWRAGDALPPLWHWAFFLPRHRQSEIGPDGHAKRGGFLPPVPLPRRMWAGGRFDFREPLRVGATVRRESRIEEVSEKSGRSGALVFVRVRHEISQQAGSAWRPALTEEHDIVYREAPRAGAPVATPQPAPADAQFERTVLPDPVLLFRYSALTFNGHRIHYDRRWCEQDEGYPGLVVHGPLQATLLAELLRQQAPGRPLARFAFRALRPLFDLAPFAVCGRIEGGAARLWVRDADGCATMEATAELS